MINYFNEILISSAIRNTFILYLAIILSTFVLGSMAQPLKYQNTLYIKKFYFTSSFLILWFFSAFCNCGVDRIAYKKIFDEVTISSILDPWQEPGFEIINLIIKIFTSNSKIAFMIISSTSIILIFSTIYYLRKHIHIGCAILAYTTLIYFQGFSLLRINLAGAIIFFATKYLINRNFIKYFLSIVFATSIHYSSIILVIPFIAYLFIYKIKISNGKKAQYLIYIEFLLLIIVAIIVFSNYIKNISFLDRYNPYFESIAFNGFGFLQFLFFLPLCFVLHFILKYYKDKKVTSIFVSFTYSAFFVGLLSYIMPMIGRAYVYFLPVYMFMIPYAVSRRRKLVAIKFNQLYMNNFIYYSCIIFYFMMRFCIYIGQYAFLDGISIYQFSFY